jgi:hypothetical protein
MDISNTVKYMGTTNMLRIKFLHATNITARQPCLSALESMTNVSAVGVR